MTFTIKGQTKAAATVKGNFGVYVPILLKLCIQVAYWPPLMICYMPAKAAAAFKGIHGVYGPN